MTMPLSHDLHVLVSLMDRHAEAILAATDTGLTFRRFLALLNVSQLDGPTQRQLAKYLGTTEAATSRMVAGLARDGYLTVERGTGNRRILRLTAAGGQALTTASAVLGNRFDDTVRACGVDPTELQGTVRALIAALEED